VQSQISHQRSCQFRDTERAIAAWGRVQDITGAKTVLEGLVQLSGAVDEIRGRGIRGIDTVLGDCGLHQSDRGRGADWVGAKLGRRVVDKGRSDVAGQEEGELLEGETLVQTRIGQQTGQGDGTLVQGRGRGEKSGGGAEDEESHGRGKECRPHSGRGAWR